MKFTIMVPVFNGAEVIQETLDSICFSCDIGQENYDVYVVDNGSTDNLVSKLRKYGPRINLIENDKNYGRVGNWNRCIEEYLARVPEDEDNWLILLFAGDTLPCLSLFWREEAVDRALKAGCTGMTSWHSVFHSNGNIYEMKQFEEERVFDTQDVTLLNAQKNWMAGCVSAMCMHRSSVFPRFDESLVWTADWKFWAEYGANNKIYAVPNVFSEFRMDARKHYAEYASSSKAHAEEEALKKYILLNLL